MAHPHKQDHMDSQHKKLEHLSGGKHKHMTAGAASGVGRLQKIGLEPSHPILEEGGEPTTTPLEGEPT